MFYVQHVACYDSGSADKPILIDGFFIIRCKMQMRSTRKAMEYITNFLISTCNKYKVVPKDVDVVVTNALPNSSFYTDISPLDSSVFAI